MRVYENNPLIGGAELLFKASMCVLTCTNRNKFESSLVKTSAPNEEPSDGGEMNGLDRSISREEKERRDSGGFADEDVIDHDGVDSHPMNEVLSQRTTSKSIPKWIELPSSEQQIIRVVSYYRFPQI